MIKAIAKKIIGEDYWSFLSWHRDHFGFLPTIQNYIYLLINNGIGRVSNTLTGGFVFLRPGTADQVVYDEIFIQKEYNINVSEPLFIVDAGAHIGLSSVFFASKYPRATVIAIEPEPSNYKMLLMNAKNYTNIKSMNAALWSQKTKMCIQNPDAPTWSFRVIEDTCGNEIEAISITDVMSIFDVNRIDILKIDIEGSELQVLNYSDSWMDYIGALIIELHDRFQPGCSEALQKAIAGFNYDKSISGESVILTNLRRTPT